MKNYLPILIFSIITLFSCSKNENIGKDTYITLAFKQTYCANPWKTASGGTESETLENVRGYLMKNNLYFESVSIRKTSEPDTCKACTCKTGNTIYVSTFNNEKMKKRYLDLGFIID